VNIQERFREAEVSFAFRTYRGRGCDQRRAWSPFNAILHSQAPLWNDWFRRPASELDLVRAREL